MAVKVGASLELRCSFTDDDSALTDPSSVVFTLRVPVGTLTTYTFGVDAELTRESTGVYVITIILSAGGLHHYRFVGTTGGNVAVDEGYIAVDWSQVL